MQIIYALPITVFPTVANLAWQSSFLTTGTCKTIILTLILPASGLKETFYCEQK
jgi:hypothetical protein